MLPSRPSTRTLCLAGLLGGLVMATGDLLMLAVPMDGWTYAQAGLDVMADVPPARLVAGGALGPLAALLYVLGAGLPWRLVSAEAPGLRALAAGGTAALGIVAGAFHATFPLLGLLVKGRASLEAAGLGSLWSWALTLDALLLLLSLGAGIAGGLALAAAILTRRTPLPRAAVLLSPLGTLPAVYALGLLLPAPVGGPVVGAAYNLALALSFAAALPAAAALDRSPRPRAQ